MRTKYGVLRVVEIEENGKWIPWCMCYKNELLENVLRYSHNVGSAVVVKYRWRLSGCDNWHAAFV